MTKNGIIASSCDLAWLQKTINEYFYSTAWVILEDLRLFNIKLNKYCEDYVVERRKGRFYFKMKGE